MAVRHILASGVAAMALTACESMPDWDMRDLGGGFTTSEAVSNLPGRPQPDNRGVISYPNYQVVVARQDDTIRTIATRLDLDATQLAAYNGIAPDTPLRPEETVALPARVTEPSPATGATAPGSVAPVDVTAIATTALDRAGPSNQQPTAPAPAPETAGQGTEPIRHQVAGGETAFIIARLYGVPVRSIAEWNGLGPDMNVREGQFLMIPQGGSPAPNPAPSPATPAPGQGSPTPTPPSAAAPLPAEDPSEPLPEEATPPAPDLGTPAPAEPASASRLAMPVQGSIIREYAPGRNEGIDIGVSAGTTVRAADSGTIAAVTTDTNGVAIVVVKHPDNLLTVYTNLENLTVAKNDTVSRGGALGSVRAGDPTFVHFEVRRGLQSVDPADFLP
jgi:murein DD-endopeptidase MepM/ murein hydrolase activator NlpD